MREAFSLQKLLTFFNKKYWRISDINVSNFKETLTNNIVSFEQPGPRPSTIHNFYSLGGRLCSFSPCIEQVQRTCEELAKHSFVELRTMECLVRNFDVRTINLPIANLGPSEKGDSNGSEPSEKQAKLGSLNEECVNDSALSSIKDGTEETAEMDIDDQESDADNSDGETKEKMHTDNKGKSTRRDFDLIGKKQDRNFFFKTAAPKQRIPGHTGFLTFATLYPS